MAGGSDYSQASPAASRIGSSSSMTLGWEDGENEKEEKPAERGGRRNAFIFDGWV